MRSLGRGLALEGNIRVLAVQTFLSQLGFGMFYVVWQPYILSTGVSVVELGVLQSVINLSSAAGLLAWGFLSDVFGRKPVILLSNACRVLAMVALILSANILFLLVFAFFVGFSALFMQGNPARSALISESVVWQRRATAFSILMAISQVTLTLTSSAGGYLAARAGFHIVFYICILGDVTGIVLMALFIRETREKQTDEVKGFTNLSTRVLKLFRPESGAGVFYLLMILGGVGYGTGYSLFNAMLYDRYGFSTVQLGLLATAFNLTWGVSSIPLGVLSDRFGRKPMLAMSSTMAVITVLGFLFSRSFEAFLLFNVTNALDPVFFVPAWVSLISERTPSRSLSTAMGKLDAYSRLAGIPAPWIGGILYSTFGFSAPLTVHLISMIASLILISTLREPGKGVT